MGPGDRRSVPATCRSRRRSKHHLARQLAHAPAPVQRGGADGGHRLGMELAPARPLGSHVRGVRACYDHRRDGNTSPHNVSSAHSSPVSPVYLDLICFSRMWVGERERKRVPRVAEPTGDGRQATPPSHPEPVEPRSTIRPSPEEVSRYLLLLTSIGMPLPHTAHTTHTTSSRPGSCQSHAWTHTTHQHRQAHSAPAAPQKSPSQPRRTFRCVQNQMPLSASMI